jgi:hypothetical protein
MDHLEYDLIITNVFVAPVTLTAIEVLAPDGETLLRLEGNALVQATQPLLSQEPTEEIPASSTVAIVMDVVVPPDLAVERLSHRITYDLAPDAPARSIIGGFEINGPELPVDPREATVIAPPLRGDGWLVDNGCCSPKSLHRSTRLAVDGARIVKQETFAIDWERLQDGRLAEGDGARPEQWFGFGVKVYAVADGTVVSVRDGLPEETPEQRPRYVKQPGDFGGNHISIRIAPGVFAFYGHLQPGSITVKVGDTVTTGQVLGLLGNTGNSTAPHLHFGLIDDPDPLVGNSLPMVFDHWTLAGTVSLEAFFADSSESNLNLTSKGTPQEQTDTLPLFLDIADFQ